MLTGLVTVLTRSVITVVHVVCDMLAHTGNHLLVTCKGSCAVSALASVH